MMAALTEFHCAAQKKSVILLIVPCLCERNILLKQRVIQGPLKPLEVKDLQFNIFHLHSSLLQCCWKEEQLNQGDKTVKSLVIISTVQQAQLKLLGQFLKWHKHTSTCVTWTDEYYSRFQMVWWGQWGGCFT